MTIVNSWSNYTIKPCTAHNILCFWISVVNMFFNRFLDREDWGRNRVGCGLIVWRVLEESGLGLGDKGNIE